MAERNAHNLAGAIAYELGDEIVLFIEERSQLLRLNPTASLVWRGLQAGMSPREMIEVFGQTSGRERKDIERDVSRLIGDLQRTGALVSPSGPNRSSSHHVNIARRISRSPRLSHANVHTYDRTYRLLEFRFKLRTPSACLDEEIQQLLFRFNVSDDDSPAIVLEIIKENTNWLLLRDGVVVDRTPTPAGITPMLHANVQLMAYQNSECLAVLHAASVIRGDSCILMPATSGSGKSTLTAALVASGFGYLSDDLVILTTEPVQVQGIPMCAGLKTGSWKALHHLFPELSNLPVYLRNDGKEVKYLPLSSGASCGSFPARAIVFPSWSPETTLEFRKISSAEALARLTSAGYDLPNRLCREVVERLIGWISALSCFELHYGRLEDAVQSISTLFP